MLFFRPEDLSLARFFTVGVPAADDVTAVLGVLATQPGADRDDVAETTGLSRRSVGRLLNLIIETASDGGSPTLERVLARAEAFRAVQRSRIEMMRGYAETRRCRREFLLQYFGERDPEECGDCDNCRAGNPQEADLESPFATEDLVRHERFGVGTVMSLEGEEITVLFDEVGYRTLSLPTVLNRHLLEGVEQP